MKLLLSVLPVLVFACSSPKNYGVGSTPAQARAATGCAATCDDDCTIDMTHLPNGNCLITCNNTAGERCEIELAFVDGQCKVVRSDCGDCGDCCPDATAHVHELLQARHPELKARH